ncbi:2-oxo-hept-4-ene-1,7-dioate hydratase [Rhodalgimonas zhirmunskyi]|uniref:2-oxo-hepta-3-ene-1,7-dioic acid hydratase n=1 Tax=Rhodalgimonas zhirmunskyi TaxID=2964767 RepID=A0AAJ1UBX5_9RHOB|nr:2-oxo-hepta-3-ene-1,7-dioic acid hydratase [Rhodoalgimonas zhirmunskyi]MDQ2095038.1 2-oxo-hepta-3-ene-1,7-dioic acid hydratase [Rhodoalgimonas zhirmunskyi]
MTPQEHQAAALSLFGAEEKAQQTGLISVAYPNVTMDDAYAIQAALVALKKAKGRNTIGWKIGLTSRAMQQALGIDIPDSGVLLDDMAFDNGATIPAGRFIQPRIEAEIAFVMKAPLTGRVTREAVLEATDYVAPSIEILDTRIKRICPTSGQPRKIFDTISDNAANAGIILGEGRFDPGHENLQWAGAIVRANGTVEETGLGAGVLGDPVMGIVWLAERMEQYGQKIEPGQVILSGSFIRPVECPPGTEIDADFGPWGHVTCRFA